jgi:DNA topoisomerase IA
MFNPTEPTLSQREADPNAEGETMYKHPRAGNSDDKAHPPIHPVKRFPGDKTGDEYRVYDLICRHFMACCSRDAVYEETEVELTIEEEIFYLKGTRTIKRNFLEIYGDFIYHVEKVTTCY